jgi:serine/threonine protein kinase
MSDVARCSRCGAELDAAATATGECSRCLLKLAVAAETALTVDPTGWNRSGQGNEWIVPAFAEGRQWGGYRVVRRLGSGGFAEVWEAEHIETGRRVALKTMTGPRAHSPEALARFKREGRLAASLNHPHCVFVFSAEQIDGYPTIAMELMAGGTLQDEISELGRIPPKQAVDYVLDAIDGLDAARAAGLIHRDVKPSNCFIGERGIVKIGDFGISKTLDADPQLTQTGAFVGTPVYASPEQVRGQALDFRGDIYSLGATLYVLLAGAPPFGEGSAGEVLARVLTADPAPIPRTGIEVPKALEHVVRRMMAKDPAKRYQSYGSVRAALLPFSSHGLSPASLALRFCASLVDTAILLPITLSLNLRFALGSFESVPLIAQLLLNPSLYYFVLSDWYWGKTLGKHLVGLRVTTTRGAPPGFLQSCFRSAILFSLAGLPALFAVAFGLPTRLIALAAVFGYVLPLLTMRGRNGYAGVHELLTGTRVMAIFKRDTAALPAQALSGSPFLGPSTLIGPYRPMQTLWKADDEELIVAEDDLLKRTVWVHRYSEGTPTFSTASLAATRPGRLRWLTGSRAAKGHWDAYEAPRGIALADWVKQRGRLSWKEMRPILTAVAYELGQRDAKTDRLHVSADHVWIDSSGDAKLLDFPMQAVREGLSFENASAFLLHLVLLGLEGRLVTADQISQEAPSVPLPDHVRPVMALICANAPLPELCARLREIGSKPAAVTRVRRLGPVLGGASIPTLGFLPVFGLLMSAWALSRTPGGDVFLLSAELARLESGRTRGFEPFPGEHDAYEKLVASSYERIKNTQMMAGVSPDQKQRLDAVLRRHPSVSQEDIDTSRALIGKLRESRPGAGPFSVQGLALFLRLFTMGIAVATIFPIVLSVFLRGSLMFSVGRISLLTLDGRHASYGRSMVRALAVWAPFFFAGLLMLIVGPGAPRDRPATVLVIVAAACTIAIGGALYSLLVPQRGLPDVIAGTHLVPK